MKILQNSLVCLLVVFLQSILNGDTIVFKDGKQIEGTILKDLGDSYEIEPEKGPKRSVKKDEIEKIVPTIHEAPAPLTGATFTFDKKRKLETVDLLASIDLKKDSINGTWKNTGKGLTVTAAAQPAKLQTAYPVPDEYDLTLELTRKEGMDHFFILLVAGGRQFTFHFDAFASSWSGLQLVDGKPAGPDSELAVKGRPVFATGTPRTVTFMVRKEAFIVRLDGKDFLTWKADWNRVSLQEVFMVPMKTSISLGAALSSWNITQMKLSFPKN